MKDEKGYTITRHLQKAVSGAVKDVLQDESVSNYIHHTIREASDESMKKLLEVSAINRREAVKSACYKNTERLLYGYRALEKHLASEVEYIGMGLKETSGSIVKFRKVKVDKQTADELIRDRMASYNRSVADFEKLQKAISSVSGSKWFRIIELRYLRDNEDEVLSYEEIAEILSGEEGFSPNLSEMTVRRHKSSLISQIAIYIFGTDSI